MEYSIQKLAKSAVEIAINVEKDEWDACILEAYNKTKHKFKIEGFRPGKVPYNVFVKRFGKEALYEEAIDCAMHKYFGEIIDKEKDLELVGRPELDVKEASEDGLKVVISSASYPTFELGAYKGLTIAKEVAEVKDEDVDKEVDTRRESACRWIDITDRAIANGDKITLDYSGSVDGVKFEGGTAEKQTLDIGSGMFIPGFEEQMIGKNIGETADIKVTFPQEYGSKELAGKDAIFTVTVHEIKIKELPMLDDEFAKDISEFDTLADLKADIKAKLMETATQKAIYAEDDKMIDTITAATDIEIPQVMVEEELDRMIDDLKMKMSYSGLKLEDYLKYLNTTLEDMRKERTADAEKTVKTRLVLEAIIGKEELKVNDDEMNAVIEKQAKDADKPLDEYKKGLNQYDMGRMANQIIADKLFAYLRTVNTIA